MAAGAGRARPRSTYRVQVDERFDLDAAGAIVGYLRDLGVSHFYASPLLRAAPGSQHGYDVVDHSTVDPSLGGEAGRLTLLAALRGAGLGMVADIVPNHMGVMPPRANAAWWDVLRLGRDSTFARWFDIDWSAGKIRLPVLSDDPDVLDELSLTHEDGEPLLDYRGIVFPVAPGTGSGDPRQVHHRQHYELVGPARAGEELNYRRFFTVADLAGLRVEDPGVRDRTHAEILRWYDAGELDGLRVDHPDGLAHPGDYLAWLRERAPRAWLVVEKILEPGERLPAWPIDGTTGYDAAREVGAVFVDPAGEAALTACYVDGSGTNLSWAETAYAAKREVASGALRPEVKRLAALAPEIEGAAEALVELLAAFGVYRTYLPRGADQLRLAADRASERRADLAPAIARLRERLGDADDELAVRFQQVTGAVMAKGVEDAALYRYTRFMALNEVGGAPDEFGRSTARFHGDAAHRQRDWPDAMTTLSTHDTKRGEDVRARLAVLSEIGEEWAAAMGRWDADTPVPGASFRHLFWQTVVGTWPIERERLAAYFEKAAREAGVDTSWAAPDERYEKALAAAVDRLYDVSTVRGEIGRFVARIRPAGWSNALAQKLVQLTMPGVPDVYQGTELWDNSLVDPDNRRPVDFAARAALLSTLDREGAPLVDESGAAKLWVLTRALRARRDRPELFTAYTPVVADGSAAAHAVAFDRGGAVTVATRLPLGLAAAGGWGDTTITVPGGEYTDVLTGASVAGGRVPLSGLLGHFPVALLLHDAAEEDGR